jgi:nicotinate-nucleotide adenylyltransferase
VIGLFGGVFDPPHNGHVALVLAARQALGLERVLVLVAAAPVHKRVETPAATRLELARAAFPDDEVLVDEHPRTVDTLRAHQEWADPVFLLGADEFCDFPTWAEPDEVLRLARLGVAARPGFPRERLDAVLGRLASPERVLFFDLGLPLASSDLRRGGEVEGVVPAAVAALIARGGLYGAARGYTGPA